MFYKFSLTQHETECVLLSCVENNVSNLKDLLLALVKEVSKTIWIGLSNICSPIPLLMTKMPSMKKVKAELKVIIVCMKIIHMKIK